MTEIHTNYKNLKNAKHNVVMGLLVCLLGEQLQSAPLTRGDKQNLYEKMGIQCDLLNQNGYQHALVTTAWQEYSEWHGKFIQNLQEMTRVAE
ncbi:hypothetical protein QBC34DRAFT_401958 [Podospora aff. communis PSN243]|uniref:Uncharacterized protein n=1 Tax=Podospora aff. communis PSN243 TaxID=3040156 RepID=A0AAV9GWQ7_9PEZI|nr:hypothetical protein QBC34DRAFT_401958 [Podospora aff. communis PSN243]